MTHDAFLEIAFKSAPFESEALWMNDELKQKARKIVKHSFSKLRVHYWQSGRRTAWVFNEIGKEWPITIGVVVESGKIQDVAILEFREVRGDEVRYPFFTRQFKGAELVKGNQLSQHIDNISGATLSVRAVNKIAKLALYFHQVVLTDEQPAEQ